MIIKYLESQSFRPEFVDLIKDLHRKYGQELFDISGIGWQLDFIKMSKEFFKDTSIDISVDANANVTDKSVIAHRIEVAKPQQLLNAYYRLWKELLKTKNLTYADHIIEQQLTGAIYINDFVGFSSSMPYCFNYSTYDTALMGIPAILDGRGGSKPPKHLEAFLGQILLFALIAGNSTLGATGLADLLIVISIYMDKIIQKGEDSKVNLTSFKSTMEINFDNYWQYLESKLTRFIYELNQPYRGSQSLFTNVSVYDNNFMDEMIEHYKLEIDGVMYQAKKENVRKVQQIYLKIMNNELKRKPLTFPVTTACFSVDEENNVLDEDFLKEITQYNMDFGFINLYAGKSSTLSSCCRLRSESDNEYFNTFGAGKTKIGSLGVCTGNLPQLAVKVRKHYKSSLEDNKFLFLDSLKYLVQDCQIVNNAKRNIIRRTIKNGNHPIYSLNYMELKHQYSTFGVVGLYEALEILGLDIMTEEGQDFVKEVMQVINDTNSETQRRYKAPHNCEQIPAENVAVKLAAKDKKLGYNNKYELYSNQFIPLIKEVDILDRIKIQGLFDKHYSGGAICHLNMDQEIKDKETMEKLIRHCIKQGVIYFAVNYVLLECVDGHLTVGNVDSCTICEGKIINKLTRVVGFLTKLNNWNKVRRTFEFNNRQFYKGDSYENS
jgi:ribonucleoside-triphosphate reductase (formate)